MHTLSEKYNFNCSHYFSDLSLYGKKFEKFQQWQVGRLQILTTIGFFTLNLGRYCCILEVGFHGVALDGKMLGSVGKFL